MSSDSDLLELGKEVHNLFTPNRNRVSSYGLGWSNGKVEDLKYPYCHMGLMRTTSTTGASPVLVITNQVQTKYAGWMGKKGFEEYYSFLFHDSVFADCYVTKDPSKCIKDGVVVRTDQPANLVVAACIATRQAWEHADVGKTVVGLIKLGLCPRKAHLAAHSITLRDDGTWYPNSRSAHVAVYAHSMGKVGVSNFLSGTLNERLRRNKRTYAEIESYRGIPEMWGACLYGDGFEVREGNRWRVKKDHSDPFNFIKHVGVLKKGPDVVEVIERAIKRMLE